MPVDNSFYPILKLNQSLLLAGKSTHGFLCHTIATVIYTWLKSKNYSEKYQ